MYGIETGRKRSVWNRDGEGGVYGIETGRERSVWNRDGEGEECIE